MCGIAGYCLKSPIYPSMEQVDSLLASVRNRGPDDEGICFISREQNNFQCYRNGHTHGGLGSLPHIISSNGMKHDIAFLHSRFSILDLSQQGHQPYTSQDGAITVIFNGEIYNYIEIRRELTSLGVKFRSQSDTEVLVEGYAKWKDALWPRMNGFWSVVLYDRRNQSLVLCRDRIGVAPLYYRETPNGLFFSSYIGSLINIDGYPATVNDDAVSGFLQTGFKDIDGSTFYSQIKTVPAATAVHISRSQYGLSQGEHRKYWYLPDAILSEKDISFEDALGKFREIIFNAVEIRLRADVKVAFELSGGLDSSSVVAIASCLSNSRITAYTAKIEGADEEPYARSMLQKYDLDYHVISKMEDLFDKDCVSFSRLMEEPYDNPNAYTHYKMLDRMNSQGVKVVITGAGGDEVFAGYESSFWPKAYQEWRKQGIEPFLKADWHEFCRRYRTINNANTTLKHFLAAPSKIKGPHAGQTNGLIANKGLSTALTYKDQYDGLSFNEQRRFHFTKALLPYYMRSSDHFTMGIPVEHRFPLLDYRLIEFGMQLPVSYLFRNGWTKYILRKAMEPYLPSKIVWRRHKMGFQFPFGRYLSAHRQTFEPYLNRSYRQHDYKALLDHDPVLLWRFLSTAIWAQAQGKE